MMLLMIFVQVLVQTSKKHEGCRFANLLGDLLVFNLY